MPEQQLRNTLSSKKALDGLELEFRFVLFHRAP